MYEIFERLLKEAKITAYKVSKDTGISQTTLSDWKRGRSVPKTEKLQIIADYFDVSLDYLLGNEQKNKPATERDELTENEKLFIEKYKQLNELGRKLADGNLDTLLNLQDKKVL